MTADQTGKDGKPFILTREILDDSLPKFKLSTKAIHADDFSSTHKAIAPCIHTAVNFRYHRDPEALIPFENTDVRSLRLPFLSMKASPLMSYLAQ